MRKILVVSGPTAIGKTSAGIFLAKKFGGEIISADSRQVYKELNIGTGKDLPKNSKFLILNSKFPKFDIGYYKIKEIPVWLLDIVSPKRQFNVADWLDCADLVIKDIWQRGKLPIIAGGTGFYIRSLINGIGSLGVSVDKKLRKKLEKLSVKELQNKLRNVAPDVFMGLNKSDRNNPRRLVRKIEILMSKIKKRRKKITADYLVVGLRADNKIIYRRIDQRVEERLETGLINEIKSLLGKKMSWTDPGMNTLAYKEFQPYFEEGQSLDDIVRRWRFDEHNYARRQLTWFKKNQKINWFDITAKNWQAKMVKLVVKWYGERNDSQGSKN